MIEPTLAKCEQNLGVQKDINVLLFVVLVLDAHISTTTQINELVT
jgi:hypothetical protein